MGLEKYKLKPLLVSGLICLVVGIIGGLLTPTPLLKMVQLCLAFFLYCIVPGYFLLLTFDLDDIERVVVATGISISIIPILLYNFDFLDWKISLQNTSFIIVGCVLVGILLKKNKR